MQVALFVFVQLLFVAPVTFFCAGMTRIEKQACAVLGIRAVSPNAIWLS
jgi:hypothetical protein